MTTRMSIDSRRWRRCAAALALWAAQVVAFAQSLPAPVLALDFDRLERGELPAGVVIRTQFAAPDVVPGLSGHAWRTDGFSSHAEAPVALDAHAGFALSLWVALESYPSDLEVPVHELAPSSIVQQAAGDRGFDLSIDTFGRWGLRVATEDGTVTLRAPARFPLRRWTHVGVNVDVPAGRATLVADGIAIASADMTPGTRLRLARVPLAIATPPRIVKILDFEINRLNAAFDTIALYGTPLAASQWASLSHWPAGRDRDASASLIVPASRFAGDVLRPRVHPMPPANWTNEPHGLVRIGEVWHLFYQRTPNGPFKTQMHWGHMTSRDLVTWQPLPDALWPELQTETFGHDMKGIWSGHVIADGGKAFAFYTSVNHGDRLAASNPGIAMAVSEDAELRHWRKLGPILNTRDVKDFRDPYLWQEGGTWHMLIGAALESGGGLEYLVLQPGEQGARWQRRPRFVDPGYRVLDPGSQIWEMPVFTRLAGDVWILVVNPIGGRVSKYGDPATRAIYWTGTWTGGVFKPFDRAPKHLDLVPGHLAPTVAAAADGTLRAIGIVDERRTPMAQKRAGWANAFGLPRAWRLLPDGRTLGQSLAPELRALRGPARMAGSALALDARAVPLAGDLRAYELEVTLDETAPGVVAIDVLTSPDGRECTRLLFDSATGSITVDKTRSAVVSDDEGPQLLRAHYDRAAYGPMRTLRIVVDGSVIEAFVNDAAAYAIRSYPSMSSSAQVRLSAPGREVTATVRLWPLQHTPRQPGD
jgi:beta-fructofuranosidase